MRTWGHVPVILIHLLESNPIVSCLDRLHLSHAHTQNVSAWMACGNGNDGPHTHACARTCIMMNALNSTDRGFFQSSFCWSKRSFAIMLRALSKSLYRGQSGCSAGDMEQGGTSQAGRHVCRGTPG